MRLLCLSKKLSHVPPLAWILAAAIVCYGGSALFQLGLYHDDWPVLEHMVFAPRGFFSAMAALAAGEPKQLLRPLSVPIFAALYTAFGTWAAGWHLVGLAANAWISWGLFRLARRYGVAEAPALAGALLFLGYPNKDSTYFWNIAGLNAYSLLFLVEALVAQADYAASGGRRRLIAAVSWFGACLASYDQSLLMAPVFLLAPGWKARRPPPRAVTGFLAAAAVTATYCGYKFGLAPRFAAEGRAMEFSLARVPGLIRDAAAAQGGWNMWMAAWQGAVIALRAVPLVAAAGLLIPAAALIGREDKSRVDSGLFALAAAVLVLSYAVFIPTSYPISPISHFNRLNNIGAFAVALAAAGAAARVPRRLGARGLAALAAACLAAHAGLALYWVVSAQMQERVRLILMANLSSWPARRALLVRPQANMVFDRAPVFLESWDIGGAVHLWTGDRTRRAFVIRPGVVPAPGGVILSNQLAPYDTVTLLDARSATVQNADPARVEALFQ
ncbi:MAG: hypothetical protein HYZ74_05185 [Elusimicrobia bacterium]|nr:hypothetical protein [Elusimicrobiota bacterium]